MLQSVINAQLKREEKKLGASLDYVRHIARVSLRSLMKLTKLLPISEYRRKLPVEPYYVAKLVATRDADCGTCVQIEVNLARKDGVAPEILKAVLADRPEDLPDELAQVYRFALAVNRVTGEEEELREPLTDRYGEAAMVEMALGMAVCRTFPVIKRTLGYAKTCAAVEVKV